MTRRRRCRWAYCVNHSPVEQQAGTMLSANVAEVFDDVAREHGVFTDPIAFEHWPTGGWATYRLPASRGGGTVSVVVVVTDPQRGDPI